MSVFNSKNYTSLFVVVGIFLFAFFSPALLCGQHKHKTAQPKQSPMPSSSPASQDKTMQQTKSADGMNGDMSANTEELMVMEGEEMNIRVGKSKDNFMSMGQMGSGTSWQPASSPMYMWYKRFGEWHLIFHGEVRAGVNYQGGPRGVAKAESQNWFMPMAFRRVGRGTLQLRGMFSLEPLTLPKPGSPQLFQTGEVFRGKPIIDAQHPHDLFMELSAQYTLPIGERGTWFAYLGFPGEPALGPVAFMHRASASENPNAPLSHHLQDSTHISFGVFTTGFTYRWFKFEGSVFNGREPDDQRYNFEFNPWNSFSGRITFAPNKNWAMQFSYGFLRNPEILHRVDTRRMTASIQYNKPFNGGNWATSLIWGRNREEDKDEGDVSRLNGYILESTVNFLERNYAYTRLELSDRAGILRVDDLQRLGFNRDAHPQFRVGAYTLGYAYDIWTTDNIRMALGTDFTFYSKPQVLNRIYGINPTSLRFYLRFRPNRMKMNNHSGP